MKTLNEMSWDELVLYNQGCITLAIPKGEFNYAIWRAMDLTLQWKAIQDKKEEK